MNTKLQPFNLNLLILSDEDVKFIRPVKVLDIFVASSRNFHPDGLFSTETFGKVGEEKRNRMFSYIDMKISVFHPIVYKALCDLKGLYGDIMAGKEYAIFDKTLKDFVKSDPIDGETGYTFFVKNYRNIVYEKNDSDKRDFNIQLVEKFADKCMLSKFVVMPAGLRDYIIEDTGKPSEDEINGLYRRILSTSSIMSSINLNANDSYLDNSRNSLQLAINAVYDYIKNMLEGKNKLILGKWATRKIFNSTRNVITTYSPQTEVLHDSKTISANQTVVGMYQYLRATLPLAVKHIRDNYLSNVFVGPNTPAILVNQKTLKRELVQVSADHYDEWMTYEGLEKIIASFGQENLRHEVVCIEDHYIGLIYKGPDNTFKFIQDIDEVPEHRSKEDASPITFAELLYISVFRGSDDIPCFATRYPIGGYGSIYPGYCYLKTTVKAEDRTELDDEWKPKPDSGREFPIRSENFFNSMSPGITHLKRLTADFDGDVMSLTCVLSENARAEVKAKLNSKDYYVGVDGKMFFSSNTEIVELVVKSMTS